MQMILLDILLEFMAKDCKLTARYFAQKYEKPIRTIMRYLDRLRDAGVPLVGERGQGGGFTISNCFKLHKIFFNEEELSALSKGAELFLSPKKAETLIHKLLVINENRR